MNNGVICHYTDLSGFKGIIESNGFWATNLSFLNDKSELIHGVECAIRALDFLSDDDFYPNWKVDFKDSADYLRRFEINDLFVICFCREPDLLSQWRGYGGSQQGVSIVFDESELLNLLRRSALSKKAVGTIGNLTLDKYFVSAKDIDYKEAEETITIKEQIKDYWNGYGDYIKSLENGSDNHHEIDYMKWLVGSITPFFKHKGFQEEGEFRILIGNYNGLSAVSFRENGRLIIPYMNLNDIGKLPIKEVVIGPSADSEYVHKSLRMFLNARGYSAVKLKSSNIPFRGQ